MNCPNCGIPVKDGTNFCTECGTAIPKIKKCISCGTELRINAKFCHICGVKQEKDLSENISTNGINIGNKNVISGNVISKVNFNTQIIHEEQIKNNINNNTINKTENIIVDNAKPKSTSNNNLEDKEAKRDSIQKLVNILVETKLKRRN